MLKEIKTETYHLLHPKTAFFVTSIDKKGAPNVMTCAWATPVSEEPPIVAVCISEKSYTAELIKRTREFVLNIPTKKLLKALWICGKISLAPLRQQDGLFRRKTIIESGCHSRLSGIFPTPRLFQEGMKRWQVEIGQTTPLPSLTKEGNYEGCRTGRHDKNGKSDYL